jgi:hypothetical protein
VVRSWRLHRRVNLTFTELAAMINPIVTGWMQYYGRFRRSALYPLLARINAYLVRWIRKKYRRLQALAQPNANSWRSPAGIPACMRTGAGCPGPPDDQDDKSPMNREVHVRICGGREGQFLPATRLLDLGGGVR